MYRHIYHCAIKSFQQKSSQSGISLKAKVSRSLLTYGSLFSIKMKKGNCGFFSLTFLTLLLAIVTLGLSFKCEAYKIDLK